MHALYFKFDVSINYSEFFYKMNELGCTSLEAMPQFSSLIIEKCIEALIIG